MLFLLDNSHIQRALWQIQSWHPVEY